MIKRLLNDLSFTRRLVGVLNAMKGIDPASTELAPDEIESSIDQNRGRPAFIFEGDVISFDEFEERANRIAHWALQEGIEPGETVALVLENQPDYPAVWFGLSKVGVTTALVNCNLEGQGLAHCINIVDAKAVIADGEQAKTVKSIEAKLAEGLAIWDFSGCSGRDFEKALAKQQNTRPSRQIRENLRGADNCIFIYTSGTTGLPKAAKLTHARMRRTFRMPFVLCDIKKSDRVYNVLPLYHITGGVLAMGGALYAGAATILRQKFSTREFWEDVSKHDASLFVYIGELCRYLLNADKNPSEVTHKIRAGFGNGLRGDVWRQFVERFNIPTMRELYGSTEGNVSFLNLDGTIGAVGQLPTWLDKKIGVAFVKFDIEAEKPTRDEKGFCIKCDVNEPGEVLGRISDKGRETFEGYHEKTATEKKILTDVFEPGDRWFRTGDLMRRDANGYVYFVDRIGDTFRWKGENVATNEVADVLSKFPGIAMANVYGVAVPGSEGRAGMAAVAIDDEIEFSKLAEHLNSSLPSYAVPLFIRIQSQVDTTGTFKFRKVEAVRDGFDKEKVNDPIWFLDPAEKVYRPMTTHDLAEIDAQNYRL